MSALATSFIKFYTRYLLRKVRSFLKAGILISKEANLQGIKRLSMEFL